jgi:hypothetical protein
MTGFNLRRGKDWAEDVSWELTRCDGCGMQVHYFFRVKDDDRERKLCVFCFAVWKSKRTPL